MDKVASGFVLHKCANGDQLPEDRISQLPRDVLVYILSFLTFKEAARTSVVSKRWTSLWTYFDRLDFNVLDTVPAKTTPLERRSLRDREMRKYVQWVNKVLQSHKALALDEFRICFDLDNSFREDIDKWLQFASIRNVQRLELDLSDCRFCWLNEEYYTFPCGLLGLRSGKFLGKIPRALTGFKSIKTLTLKRVNVHQEVLEFFLHNCQFLECMVVHDSKKLVNLEVSGPVHALKHLEICYCNFLKSFRLCNANLVSLKITALRNLVLKNVPMLINVCLHGCRLKFGTIIRDVIPGLSCCVSKLEVLTLFLSPYYATELEEMPFELPQLPCLKQLTFEVFVSEDDESLLGLTAFIRGGANLEKLVIKLRWEDERGRRGRKLEKAINYPLQHLKVFELSGYYGCTREVELVKFFSENAVTLEKIIIAPREYIHYNHLRRQMDSEQVVREYARRQLKGLIASHVELEILSSNPQHSTSPWSRGPYF